MLKGSHVTTSFSSTDDWNNAELRISDPGSSFRLSLKRSNTHGEIAEKLEKLAKQLRHREEDIRNDR